MAHFEGVITKAPNTPGIYLITCFANGQQYVGSSINIRRRWREHLAELLSQKHRNRYMQNCYNKYGVLSFSFEILELVPRKELLLPSEQWWIDVLKPRINNCKFAKSRLGIKSSVPMPVSPETRKKISDALKGRNFTDEHRIALSEGNKKIPKEVRIKNAQWRIGVPRPLSTRKKISESAKGKPSYVRSAETLEKLRKSAKKSWILRREKYRIKNES